jgi:TolA-binding protein
MEAYVAQPTEEGKDPKTPVEAVAHVLSKSTFLRNVGLQSTEMKRNAKSAAMNDRVHDLESKLEAEKMGSAGLRSQVADLQKQLEEQKEAARKNEEETEKLKQQGSDIQGFLRSLLGNKFASGDAQP